MAMACLRLFTFFPLRPLFNLPRFIAFISRSTDLPALGLYLRRDEDLRLLPLPDDERFERPVLRCERVLADERLLELRLRLDFLVAAMRI